MTATKRQMRVVFLAIIGLLAISYAALRHGNAELMARATPTGSAQP